MNKSFLRLISLSLFHQQTPCLKLTFVFIRKPCSLPYQMPQFLFCCCNKMPDRESSIREEGFIQCTVPGHSQSLWGNQGRTSKWHIHSQEQREKDGWILPCLLAFWLSGSFPHSSGPSPGQNSGQVFHPTSVKQLRQSAISQPDLDNSFMETAFQVTVDCIKLTN